MTELSHMSVWGKLKQIRGIETLLTKALLLYALIVDADFPAASKILAVAAIAYLVNPFDVIPDLTPFLGYVDDLTVIVSAISKLSTDIQSHHHTHAQQMLAKL